ncbi:hypothetical protein [Microcystis aeruginosa]|uniref:hypothetical protein n=1 Tax=Microcystis aeruginosa TaxID=1126 RepID=UPI00139696FA|nr:hypothetical protein [Microcystis aeruginosa]
MVEAILHTEVYDTVRVIVALTRFRVPSRRIVTDGRQFFRGQKDGGSVPAISRSPVQSINPSQERRSLNTIMAISAI